MANRSEMAVRAFSPAGKLHHVLQLFAGRLGDNPHACLQHVRIRIQLQGSLSATEQFFESLVKLYPNRANCSSNWRRMPVSSSEIMPIRVSSAFTRSFRWVFINSYRSEIFL